MEFIRHVAIIWLAIGLGGLLFRTVHLFFIKDVQTGLVWVTKIVTDPFHDIKLYHRAPLLPAARRADRSACHEQHGTTKTASELRTPLRAPPEGRAG